MSKSGTCSVFRFVLFRSHRLTLSMPVSLSFTVVDFDFVLLMKHVQKAAFESLAHCLGALRRIDWCDVFYCCACFGAVLCRVLCCLVSGTGTGTRETGTGTRKWNGQERGRTGTRETGAPNKNSEGSTKRVHRSKWEWKICTSRVCIHTG